MSVSTAPSQGTTSSGVTVAGVLVVGGGYAGLYAATAARSAGVATTIVDPTGRHDLVTRLAAVAGGASPADDASCELSRFEHDVIIGRVTAVADGSVTLDDDRVIRADAVVVCAGARSSQPGIPGIEHAMPLRTADQALEIRARLADATDVIVIGGGATGVQLAGAIAHAHADVGVHVVEQADHLLAALSAELGAGAERILRDRGVMVTLAADVEKITGDGAVIDGVHHDGLVVWAGGFESRADGLGVEVDDEHRIVVDRFLRIDGMSRTFAAGDIAAHRDRNRSPLAMSAQVAVQAGSSAGENAARSVAGDDLKPAALVQRGWVVDLRGQRGLAEFGPIKLAEPFADLIPPLLHTAIDLRHRFDIGGLGALDI